MSKPLSKRYRTSKRTSPDIFDSDDDSGSNCHKRLTPASHKTKRGASFDEIGFQEVGLYYEADEYSDFNEVLDTCPLVCASVDLPPVVDEVITLLVHCLDFDLVLKNVQIKDEVGTMTSAQIIECLKLAKVKIAERFDQYSNQPQDKSLRLKCCSLRCAKKFTNSILEHMYHMQRYMQIPVTDGYFAMMVSHFGSMCNLDPQFFSLYNHFMIVKDQMVTSIPDVRFTYTDETDDSNFTVSVVEVKNQYHKIGEGEQNYLTSSTDTTHQNEGRPKFHIHNFLGEEVLEQHGIKLLVESFYSAKKQDEASHIFGMIVVGFQVIFTCLYITDNELQSLNASDAISVPRRGIKYSKPFNILSSSDRNQAYKILFRLSEKITR